MAARLLPTAASPPGGEAWNGFFMAPAGWTSTPAGPSSWDTGDAPLGVRGRCGDPSGTVVVLIAYPLCTTDTAVCLGGERGLARPFLPGVGLKGTLVARALAEVVGLPALERGRSSAPSQGEDWLVGMAALDEAVVTSGELRFGARSTGRIGVTASSGGRPPAHHHHYHHHLPVLLLAAFHWFFCSSDV